MLVADVIGRVLVASAGAVGWVELACRWASRSFIAHVREGRKYPCAATGLVATARAIVVVANRSPFWWPRVLLRLVADWDRRSRHGAGAEDDKGALRAFTLLPSFIVS